MAISAELQAQLNRVNCGAANVLGTGTHNCPFNRKRVIAVMFTTQGFEFEEEMSLAYLQELQQRGVALVLGKVVNFVPATAEDSINTYDTTGIKSINGKRPYEYVATWDNGIYFAKALAALESFGNYDVTYFDEALSILFTSTATSAKGLTCGQIGANPYQGATGNAPSSESAWWQELYRSEFDIDATWITAANHDIRASNLDGVNDMVFEFDAVPSDGDTTIKFTAKTKADMKSVTVGGLLPANVVFTVAGVVKTISTIGDPDANGVYTGTFTGALATGNALELKSNDATYPGVGIILKGGRLYKSNILTATAIA